MNSFKSLGGGREIRRGFLVALALVASFLGMSLMASTASAGSVSCSGSIKPDKEGLAENSLQYNIKCSEDIQGYSIITNRELGYFGTDIIVFDGAEISGSEAFTCEGSIPGHGTGCYGTMAAGHVVQGDIATSDELCEAATQPEFWVTVLTSQTKSTGGNPYNVVSEPFTIPYHCDTLNAKKKAAVKATKLCGKVKTAADAKSRAAAKRRCQAALKASKKLHQA